MDLGLEDARTTSSSDIPGFLNLDPKCPWAEAEAEAEAESFAIVLSLTAHSNPLFTRDNMAYLFIKTKRQYMSRVTFILIQRTSEHLFYLRESFREVLVLPSKL